MILKSKFVKEQKIQLVRLLKLLFFLILANICYIFFGTLIFLYIEHCKYKQIPPLDVPESDVVELCTHVLFLNSSSNFTSTPIQKQHIEKMISICSAMEIEDYSQLLQCEVNFDTMARWAGYCTAVIYTIGNVNNFTKV